MPRLYDTSTAGLVATPARPAADGPARIYVCGITPYDATHIGHAATFLAWDLLVRAWRDAGHQVSYVQNVTDVDDPLLERAARYRSISRSASARQSSPSRSARSSSGSSTSVTFCT